MRKALKKECVEIRSVKADPRNHALPVKHYLFAIKLVGNEIRRRLEHTDQTTIE